MGNLRIGIIGIGNYAAGRHVPEFRETGLAEVVAISRRNQELLRSAQTELGVPNAYHRWEEMLDKEQLDGVVVSTSVASHPEPTIAALGRGMNVLVEKPLALTAADAISMAEAATRSSGILMVGYNCRLRWQWRWAQNLIEQGRLGQIRHISGSWCADMRSFLQRDEAMIEAAREKAKSGGMKTQMRAAAFKSDNWRFDPDQVGSVMLVEVCTHLIDLFLWLCGEEPAEVHAKGSPIHDFGSTSVSVLAQLTSGALCSLSFADSVAGVDGAGTWGDGNLTIWGDEGVLFARWNGLNPRRASVEILRHGVPLRATVANLEDMTPAAGFVKAIRTGNSNPCPGEGCIGAVRFIEATLKSIAENRPIVL